jgi:hypothetical protein
MGDLKCLALAEQVLQAAKEGALEAAAGKKGDYDSGMVMAYYDVLTVAIEQAEILDIPLKDIGLDGFDPDKLLVRAKQPV